MAITKSATEFLAKTAVHPISWLGGGIGAMRASNLTDTERDALRKEYKLSPDANLTARSVGRGLVGGAFLMPGLGTGKYSTGNAQKIIKKQQKAESIQKEASAAGLVLKGLTGFGKSLSSGVKALKPMAENVLPAAKQSLNKAKMNVTKTPGPHKPGKVLSTLKTNFNKLDSGSQQGLRNVGMTAGIGAAGLGGYAIGQGKQPMSDPVMTLPRMYAR